MVRTLDFVVLGSQGDPYEITATRSGDTLALSCDCPAGGHGLHCRHRLALLKGDITALDSNNPADVKTLIQWLHGTPLEQAIVACDAAQARFDAAKSELARRKKAMGRIMDGA